MVNLLILDELLAIRAAVDEKHIHVRDIGDRPSRIEGTLAETVDDARVREAHLTGADDGLGRMQRGMGRIEARLGL